MAKVIERGISPDTYRWRYRCSKCESLIEFDRNDVQSDQREGSYVKCPVCKSFIDWRVVKEKGELLKGGE
jgi:DNA-directed RNA polymerase subunit RPC12/RpoP